MGEFFTLENAAKEEVVSKHVRINRVIERRVQSRKLDEDISSEQ